jgi:hypothetical protein
MPGQHSALFIFTLELASTTAADWGDLRGRFAAQPIRGSRSLAKQSLRMAPRVQGALVKHTWGIVQDSARKAVGST